MDGEHRDPHPDHVLDALGDGVVDIEQLHVQGHLRAAARQFPGEIQAAGAFRFRDYWSVFGSVTYDIGNHVVSRNGIGLSYDDRDTIFSIVYEQERDKSSSVANDWSIGARLMFRTIGDIRVGDAAFTGLE